MVENISIVSLAILCKLSDGSVRVANTGRTEELQILKTINPNGELTLSEEPIIGVDIEMPANFKSLF